MLHLALARWRSVTPYVVGAAAVLVALWLDGAKAFRYDGYWLQHFEAALFLWLGARVFRVDGLSAFERAAICAGCAWLAMDEALMFHECVRMKFKLSGPVADPFVVAYLLAASVAGVRLIRCLPGSARAHLGVAALAAVLVVVADLGGMGRGPWAHVLEESSEFLALAGALAALAEGRAAGRLAAAAWAAFSFAWMFSAFWLVRPWVCPSRLL